MGRIKPLPTAPHAPFTPSLMDANVKLLKPRFAVAVVRSFGNADVARERLWRSLLDDEGMQLELARNAICAMGVDGLRAREPGEHQAHSGAPGHDAPDTSVPPPLLPLPLARPLMATPTELGRLRLNVQLMLNEALTLSRGDVAAARRRMWQRVNDDGEMRVDLVRLVILTWSPGG